MSGLYRHLCEIANKLEKVYFSGCINRENVKKAAKINLEKINE
jgi:hypothetical protein